MDFSFGFWKTSAAYISLEVKKPFYYYSPTKVYDNYYNILNLSDDFGYCKNENDIENLILKII